MLVTLIILIASPLYCHAGFSKYESFSNNGGVVAPVQFNGKSLYNLVVSVQFIREPYEKKPYESDIYHALISRLSVEWKGIVIQKILDSSVVQLSGLADLKVSIESAINELIITTKPKYGIKKDAEVIFSVHSFYLVEVDSD